ncbi:putative cell wall binding repeat 2 [Clostridium magnum DSM 2767]|uniref:Putative cell wall binding repeat 2 n=1 Tax=Clostridium magnum DSM 2767 TaxID=1121326 RepID=A0A162SUR7_9CLOT|nr:putative cell wall binding repeat 2 [Clostridium magnum DSM 2767]
MYYGGTSSTAYAESNYNGYGFADALSVSSVAALKGYPILMTSASTLPDETKNILSTVQPSQVYVI